MARRFHPARKYVVTNSDDALSRFMGGELASPEFRFAAKTVPRLGELGVHSLIIYDNHTLSYIMAAHEIGTTLQINWRINLHAF